MLNCKPDSKRHKRSTLNRLQVAAFHARFKQLRRMGETIEESFAEAIVQSSDDVFAAVLTKDCCPFLIDTWIMLYNRGGNRHKSKREENEQSPENGSGLLQENIEICQI